MELIAVVGGIGPATFEQLGKKFSRARTQIIEFGNDFVEYRFVWTLEGLPPPQLVTALERDVIELGGCVERVDVGILFGLEDDNPKVPMGVKYLEYIVPMKTKNRHEACYGLATKLKYKWDLTVKTYRDRLTKIKETTVETFFVVMSTSDPHIPNNQDKFELLVEVLSNWKNNNNSAWIGGEAYGRKIIFDGRIEEYIKWTLSLLQCM